MATTKSLMRRSGIDEALINMQYLEIESDRVELSPLREYAAGGSCILRIGICTTLDSQRKDYVRMNVGVKVFKIGHTEEDRIKTATRFVKELEVWATLKHENLLPLSGYYISRDLSEAWLISEWQYNGNIQEYTREQELDVRLRLLRNVLKALVYLHSMRPPILHRDIKPGNVLIGGNPPRAMLCDFGLCKSPSPVSTVLTHRGSTEASVILDSDVFSCCTSGDHIFTSQSDEVKGTFRYMAPELFQQTPPPYSEASDMWAWACTAHEIISGEAPYGWCTTEPKVLRAMHEGHLPSMKIYTEGSWEFVRHLSKCWKKNPRGRPSARKCLVQLQAVYHMEEPMETADAIQKMRDIDRDETQLIKSVDGLEWLQEEGQTIRIDSITAPTKDAWFVRIAQWRIAGHAEDWRSSSIKWVVKRSYDVPYTSLPTFLQRYINHHAHRFRHEDLDWITWSLHDPPKVQFVALYLSKPGSLDWLELTRRVEWSTFPRLDVLLCSVGLAGLKDHLTGFEFAPDGGTLTFGYLSLRKVEEASILVWFPVSRVPPVEDPEKAGADDHAIETLLKFAQLRCIFARGILPPELYRFCAAYFLMEVPGGLRRLQDCARQSETSLIEIDSLVEGALYGREDSSWNNTELRDKQLMLITLLDDVLPIIRSMMRPYLEGD